MRFSKAIIVVMVIFTVLFTIRVLDIFERTGMEPVTLIVSVFGVVAAEFKLLSLIKKWESE